MAPGPLVSHIYTLVSQVVTKSCGRQLESWYVRVLTPTSPC